MEQVTVSILLYDSALIQQRIVYLIIFHFPLFQHKVITATVTITDGTELTQFRNLALFSLFTARYDFSFSY